MKTATARKSRTIVLSLILALVSVSLLAGPATAATTRIPIVNYFVSCEEVSVDKAWLDDDGVKHVRGKLLVGEVKSNEDFHTGPATNLANANVVMATGYGTFYGRLDMRPEAFPCGWWEGSYVIRGVPGEQTGMAWLKGHGDLAGYWTRSKVTHMPGSALHELFPEACGGTVPVGGSRAEGFVIIPGGG